jgi:hypothetical protein
MIICPAKKTAAWIVSCDACEKRIGTGTWPVSFTRAVTYAMAMAAEFAAITPYRPQPMEMSKGAKQSNCLLGNEICGQVAEPACALNVSAPRAKWYVERCADCNDANQAGSGKVEVVGDPPLETDKAESNNYTADPGSTMKEAIDCRFGVG